MGRLLGKGDRNQRKIKKNRVCKVYIYMGNLVVLY